MELPKIDVDLDEPAEPAGPSPAHRVWAVVVVIQALAALAVGLVVSVVGFFGNATISLLASMLPWSDPVRLAVPLFVAGAVLAAVVARRVRGLGSRAAGWVVAAAGAVVACVPLLVVRLVDGDIKGVTLDAGDIVPQSPAVRGAVTLAQAVGLGLAVGGVLAAQPLRAPSTGGSRRSWSMLPMLVPALFAAGLAGRVGVNTGWQTRLSVIAPVAAVIAAVVTYGYDRYTTRAAGTTGQTPDDGVARGPDRERRGWWVPAAVVLGVVLCALVARTVTERGYEGAVLTLLSTDPDGSGARVGLVVMTLVPVALAVVVGGVAARWWGRAALRVTAVALAAGTALGVQTILVHDHSRILTCIVAAGAAVGAVLLVGRSRGVPWDILGVLAAGVGAGTTLIRSTHGTSVSALSYALIIAGVVMALVGSLPVVRSLPASARGLLVGLGAVLFMAAAPVAVRIGASVLFSDPQTLGPAYRHQFWILAMLPTALAAVAAVLAWLVGTRRMRRMPESIGMTG